MGVFATLKAGQLAGERLALVTKVSAALTQGGLFAALGGRGGGKTVASCAIAYKALTAGKTIRYTTATQMLMEWQACFGPRPASSQIEIFQIYREPGFLVIDEVGRSKLDSDFTVRILTELIDARYGDLTSTLLVSNQTPEGFEQSVGDSIVSRLNEAGGILKCNWPSFRDL